MLGYGVVTSGEAFKTTGVGVVHFSVSWFSIIIYKPQPLSFLDMILLISFIGTLANKNGWMYHHSPYSPVWGPWGVYIWLSLLQNPDNLYVSFLLSIIF